MNCGIPHETAHGRTPLIDRRWPIWRLTCRAEMIVGGSLQGERTKRRANWSSIVFRPLVLSSTLTRCAAPLQRRVMIGKDVVTTACSNDQFLSCPKNGRSVIVRGVPFALLTRAGADRVHSRLPPRVLPRRAIRGSAYRVAGERSTIRYAHWFAARRVGGLVRNRTRRVIRADTVRSRLPEHGHSCCPRSRR